MDKPKKRPKGSSGISRRHFLRSVGVSGGMLGPSVLGAAALVGGTTGKSPNDAPTLGPGAVPVKLNINGKEFRVEVEPRVTLLDAMRERMGLTGAKRVCDRGECGACTVLVEGRPVYACMMLAVDAQGKKIATIEGLASGLKLDPLQTAFIKHDALQCGFCTPGFLMALKGLLLKNPHPSREEVRLAISGNVCRCGTYPKIFAAVSEVSKA